MDSTRHIRNLALIGFMGTGKSSVGRLVASNLHFTYLDTDDVIEARAGAVIADIFKHQGGGGLPVNEQNMASLKTHALTICLWASPEKILHRVKDQTHRPLLNEPDPLGKIRQLLAERERFYKQADVLVTTDFRSLREVAQQVMNQFRMATRQDTAERR